MNGPTEYPGEAAATRRRRVVVTGYGVVSPIGTGAEAFGAGLRSARPGVGPIRRFDARSFVTRVAGEVDDLDTAAVTLPEREAPALLRDPKSLYGLLAGREAMAMAFGPQRDAPAVGYAPERVSAYIATGLEIFNLPDLVPHVTARGADGVRLLQQLQARPAGAFLQIPANLGARCLARELGAGGALAVNVSACAASAQAIGEALLAVRCGATDVALAGGYDSMINPLGVGGFCLLKAMSTANELGAAASRPFDARRDGFVLGEGAALFVLETLERAQQRGAEPLAELLGYATTLDAFQVTAPDPEQAGAIAAMRGALSDARRRPEQIDWVSAHGTATWLNDRAETQALRAVMGAHADRVPVSGSKSQLGHLIGAAGAVELATGLFALRSDLLPATINLTDPDPACDLDYVPLQPRRARVRTFLSNSFGFGGQNACLVAGRVDHTGSDDQEPNA